jgi:hypothetical protein
MVENLIVFLIVAAAVYSAWGKWLRPKKTSGGCGSGCNTCDTCETPTAPPGQRVIMMRKSD